MNIKEALKHVVRYEMSHMEWIDLSEGQMETLVEEIHDSEDFQQRLAYIIEDAVHFWAEELNINLDENEVAE